jgi:hypothetical protein
MRIQSYPKRISLETDGFSASHHVGGVNYMRRFHLESDRLVVEDRFDRPTPHVARVMFAPEVEVLQGPDGSIRAERCGVILKVVKGLRTDVLETVERPYSPRYGAVTQTRCLLIRRTADFCSIKFALLT